MIEQKQAYMRQLDGLRALCVAAVAWSHWDGYFGFQSEVFSSGQIGVETFFVISGFLITGILLDNRLEGFHGLVLRQFYIRRFLRIFPLFYVVFGLACLLDAESARATWSWHVSYLSNLYFYWHGWCGALSHFWSLAVEEQFYLFWPVLIFLVPVRYLYGAIILTISIAPFFALVVALQRHIFVIRVGVDVLMPSCLSALGMGAWLAYRARDKSRSLFDLRWLLILGILGYAACYAWGLPVWLQPFGRLAEDCVLGWLVFIVAGGIKGPAGRFLEWAPVNYLGRISYGFYIIHNFAKPLTDGTLTALNHPDWMTWLHQSPWACIPLFIVVTVGLASASWYLYEKRLNDLKQLFPYPASK